MARRALFQANPNMWNAGAVVFKMPHSQYANQMAMHQLSKQEALGQYYNKLLTNINPAGVRGVDMAGWQKKVNDWQEFGTKHRNQLINPRLDGGEAQRQFMAMHTDLLGDLDKSKAAADAEKAVRQVYLNPKIRALATNQDMQIGHALSSSIYDPNHYKPDGVTQYTPEDFSFNAPPFDTKKQSDALKYVARGLKLQKTPDLRGKTIEAAAQRVIVPYKQSFGQESLKQIGDRMAGIYDNDKGAQAYFDNILHDEEGYNKLNAAYKSVYGQDQEIGTDPRKAAQAWAIANNNAIQTGTDSYHWQRPPQPRNLSQAQQAQADMQQWIKGTANAIKNGDINEIKRLGGVLYSGNGKSQYQDVEYGQLPQSLGVVHQMTPKAVFHHIDKQWVPDVDSKGNALPTGQYKEVMNQTELDPNDPQLENKLGNLYQQHMGSTPGMEKVLLKQAVGGGAAPKQNDNPLNLKF